MEWIKNEGLSDRFSKTETNGSNSELIKVFNEIIEIISDSRIAGENEQFYFQQALQAIGTSVISFNDEGIIDIFNPAAQLLLGCKPSNTITELKQMFPEFANLILRLKNNELTIFKIDLANSLHVLSIKCVDFKLRKKEIRLISFQDITNELANEELDAWQKVIKVLRHEIMNSVTPIKSLTSTLIRLISINGKSKKQNELSDETINNIYIGLQAIEKRNLGMLNFVESYRNLTNIKTPELGMFYISGLMENITTLLNDELKSNHIILTSTS